MNPLMMMIQMAQRGRNPLGALQQMGAGPQLQQMQQMLAGKNYNQLLQMADNAARERGTAEHGLGRPGRSWLGSVAQGLRCVKSGFSYVWLYAD